MQDLIVASQDKLRSSLATAGFDLARCVRKGQRLPKTVRKLGLTPSRVNPCSDVGVGEIVRAHSHIDAHRTR